MTNRELRDLIRCFVDNITLTPAQDTQKTNQPVAHEITLNLKAMPAMFVKGMGAGTLSVVIYNALAAWMVRRWRLAKNGRKGLASKQLS